MVKGKLYQVEVGDALTISHGWGGYLIWELYVPEIGVVANERNGCFKSECRAEGEIIDVEIDNDYARKMKARASSEDPFRKVNNKYFDIVKEKYKDKIEDTMPAHLKKAIEEAKAKTTFATTSEDDEPLIVQHKDEAG